MPEQPQSEQFIGETLRSLPRWVMTVFGMAIGSALCLSFFLTTTGLQGPLVKYANVYVKRIEASVNRLELTAEDMRSVTGRLETAERSMKDVSSGLEGVSKRLDSLNAQMSDHATRLRELEQWQSRNKKAGGK